MRTCFNVALMDNGKNEGLSVRRPRRWPQLYSLLAIRTWTYNITSLCLSFLVCKMGKNSVFLLASQGVMGAEEITCYLGGGPAYSSGACCVFWSSRFLLPCGPALASESKEKVILGGLSAGRKSKDQGHEC